MMIKLTSFDLSGIIGGKLYGPKDKPVIDVVTDSRQSAWSDGLVFFAIKGKNHDAHQFIINLYEKGVRVFVVERLVPEIKEFHDASFIVTSNSIAALQKTAAYCRRLFTSPVIAVTGSTGKTIVKEWLADIIGQVLPVVRSPKSYNSQIGVPLSVLKLHEKYKMAVFEAGISMPGEMDNLQKIVDPDIGVITNIGEAHSENFRDDDVKTMEKLHLFRNSKKVVFHYDDELIRKHILNDKALREKELFSWSFQEKAARIYVKNVNRRESSTVLSVSFEGKDHEFKIPFSDRASIQNSITAATTCFAAGIDPQIIAKGLENLTAVAMRMELKSGINNCKLIEDFYNSDPGSLVMAVEFLISHKGRNSVLILSDFVQSRRPEAELYGEVAELISRSGIKRFVGIGKALVRNKILFDDAFKFYESTDAFISDFKQSDFRNDIILLKGARVYEFEKIAQLLEEQIHQTVLEINLDAIAHNINVFRNHLHPGTRMMAMVKAFAYGAGPTEIASLLEYQRVSYLAVAYADEGVELRNAGVSLPIMVMNPDPASPDLMIRNQLEPEIYSFESLDRFISASVRHGLVGYPIHIKIDTGMHRLGFMPGECRELSERIKMTESLKIVSVFSHLAGSDDQALDFFTHKQADVFMKTSAQIQDIVGYPFLRHLLNSSGILRFPQYQFEMVRPGIGIYGAGQSEGADLKVTSRYMTRISQVKKIAAGEPVGYGCADVADHDRLVAIVPVGYADGLRRNLGNRKGSLFINGERLPIVGNVCMDMCMVDVTGTGAKSGDEAEVFGDNIPIGEVAALCDTIPYEILTSVPRRVKRIFYTQ
ncbi:MAG TPA: bifunctional UDP-N-acetylmuramoyl-tripeptide:D-alanyl-D-alanine ligase/alanine racemase [Bacteroidales bacterium]|nr:bifunctional UDP-N-acetylmuramoyl-tripeptide:D-alanyl-D-alanine ligase/alanine racemase [Bacteroidales bacterium]